jgi:hypothetical protein
MNAWKIEPCLADARIQRAFDGYNPAHSHTLCLVAILVYLQCLESEEILYHAPFVEDLGTD